MGNTLLSDDGIGIITKRYLQQRLGEVNNIDCCETSWGGFKIIDLLKGYDYAIIIDSIKTGLKPMGFIHFLEPSDLLPTLRLTSYHDINFITAIKLANQLQEKIPANINILAIEIGNNNTISENIDPALWDSIYKCSEKIIHLLKSHKIIRNELYNIKPINSIYEINELYKEDSLEHSTEPNQKFNQLEEYLA